MNRLSNRMQNLAADKKKAFIAYMMAGEPNWQAVEDIILELEQAGVTAIELGVPFSDPIADGPVIQEAANRALASGVTLTAIFDRVAKIRAKSDIPILLMGYWNVFLQYGKKELLEHAAAAGVDGFIIVDLPYEAEVDFFRHAGERELATVMLAAELTSTERLKMIVRHSTGFIYYVPQLGITGLDLSVTTAVRERIRAIRGMTDKPVCVGLGVKQRADVAALNKVADGVIVGTRIVQSIEQNRDSPQIGLQVAKLVKSMIA